jgi:hypothetical protein
MPSYSASLQKDVGTPPEGMRNARQNHARVDLTHPSQIRRSIPSTLYHKYLHIP